jgi:hypothetical protein
LVRRPPFGRLLPHSLRVPPLPFLPTTAVCSACGLAGLLRPAASHGVRHVSADHTSRCRLLPVTHTLRSLPLHSSRTASPRPLPSHRWPAFVSVAVLPRWRSQVARVDLRALLRCEIRCSSRSLRSVPSPLLPWAWLHAAGCVPLPTTRCLPGSSRRSRKELHSRLDCSKRPACSVRARRPPVSRCPASHRGAMLNVSRIRVVSFPFDGRGGREASSPKHEPKPLFPSTHLGLGWPWWRPCGHAFHVKEHSKASPSV